MKVTSRTVGVDCGKFTIQRAFTARKRFGPSNAQPPGTQKNSELRGLGVPVSQAAGKSRQRSGRENKTQPTDINS